MSPSRIRTLLPAVAAAALLACGHDTAPRAASDAAAMNAAPAWSEGRGWTIEDTPSVVIGEAEGAEAYQFDVIASALRLADGTVVVGDRGSGQVRWFTARGEHLRSVGRKGDGPGEFRVIEWIGARGDSVLVWDPFARRLTVLGPGGAVARMVRVAQGTGVDFLQGVGMMGSGTLVLRAVSVGDISSAKRPARGEHVDSATYLRVSTTDGRLAGTLGPYLLGDRVTVRAGRMSLTEEVIFGRRGVLAMGPQGFFTGTTDAFRLTAHAEDGRPLRTVGRPHRSTRASGGDVRLAVEQRRSQGDLGKTMPAMRRVQQAALENPPHRATLAAFTRVLVDGAGNVWMEEFRIDPQQAGTWTVLDPGGRWLGQVTAPAGVEVLQIGRDAVLGRTRDELGVERITVHPLLR